MKSIPSPLGGFRGEDAREKETNPQADQKRVPQGDYYRAGLPNPENALRCF